jgi:choline dehydrogenase-like flavoprotein
MLIDVLKHPPAPDVELTADVCVIGAGAAGLTLTRELTRRGLNVITLEGGGLKETKRSQNIYQGENVGRKYFRLHRARRRYLGGSTNCWAGLCTRLRPLDFEARSWVPHSGWPITHLDLEPYYESARDILEIGEFHPQLDREITAQEKQKDSSLHLPKFESVFFQMSAPVRLGKLWRTELEQEPKARILYHANVTHLQMHESGTRLDHVLCKPFQGNTFKVRASRYVLACGGIENPRMLLNARDVMSQGIGNQHDLVGRFFMEHPHIDRESLWIPSGEVPSLAHYRRRTKRGKSRTWPYLRLSAEELRREEILDFSFVLFKKRLKREEKKHPLIRAVFESAQHLNQAGGGGSRLTSIPSPYTFGNPMEQAPNP